MNKKETNSLTGLIRSRIKTRLLILFFGNPGKRYFQSELLGNDALSAVQKELTILVKAEILTSQTNGRRRVYWVNKKHPLYSEIRNLITKAEKNYS